MSRVETGTVLDFSYTGSVQEITLPKGTYRLECWGAQGGDANATYALGGRGGFASGVIKLIKETKIFVYVGQSGPVPASVGISQPAFNGGGYGNTSSTTSTYRVSSGGGASDIRIGTDSLFARVIVAGAGGGSGYASTSQHCNGGVGGGETGGDGEKYSTYVNQGYGGTQTEGGGNGYATTDNYGSFGQGGNDVTASKAGGGGGGGWYGGGASDGYFCGAGGGSGFVWTGLNAPDGYLLTEEHLLTDTQNIAGDTAFAAPDGTEETGHSGDGFVRITALEVHWTPENPGNFHVESETDQSVSLAWDAAENSIGYRLRRNGILLVDTSDTSVTVETQAFEVVIFTLSAYNEFGESGETSLSYVNLTNDPVLYLVTDRFASDVFNQNEKGTYNATDLNRVGVAVEYVASRMRNYGNSVAISPKKDWTAQDTPTEAQMQRYLADVAALRAVLAVLPTTPEVPPDMDGLTYTEANNIEQILKDIDILITNMTAAWFYSGDLYSGEV